MDNLVELIQGDASDCLGVVKTVKMDTLIPANNESSVPCRVKTGDIDRTLPVLSERDDTGAQVSIMTSSRTSRLLPPFIPNFAQTAKLSPYTISSIRQMAQEQ